MILQTELYWNCHALITLLKQEHIDNRRVSLLAIRQSENLKRFAQIVGDMHTKHPTYYTAFLLDASRYLTSVFDRALLLSCDSYTQDLSQKYAVVAFSLAPVVELLQDAGWQSSATGRFAVTPRGQFILSPHPEQWLSYPDRAWGCFNAEDVEWAQSVSPCTLILPCFVAGHINTPNYFWWSCIYGIVPEEERSPEVQQELIRSLLSYVTEEDAGSVIPNSKMPTFEQLLCLHNGITGGYDMQYLPQKTRETCHDILASRESIGRLQMKLLQLLF